MNMQKLGTVAQSKPRCKNGSKTGLNPMNTGLRVIHYANIRARKSGTVRGIVSHLTYLGLPVLPSLDPVDQKKDHGKLINSCSGVTRSHSVQILDWKTSLQNLAKPYGLTPPAVLPPEKILFHLGQIGTPCFQREFYFPEKILFRLFPAAGGCHE